MDGLAQTPRLRGFLLNSRSTNTLLRWLHLSTRHWTAVLAVDAADRPCEADSASAFAVQVRRDTVHLCLYPPRHRLARQALAQIDSKCAAVTWLRDPAAWGPFLAGVIHDGGDILVVTHAS